MLSSRSIETKTAISFAGGAQEVTSALVAERGARALALDHAGTVAFSRTGDTSIGDFQDAVSLAQFGDVDLDSLSL